MNPTIKTLFQQLLIIACSALPLSQAHALLLLDNWNDTGLATSGDYIEVHYGIENDNSWFAMQWITGSDNLLTALGIDQVYYNCLDCAFSPQPNDNAGTFGGVQAVFSGTTAGTGGTDITNQWSTNKGSLEGGGGFGAFTSRMNQDGGSTDGIGNILTFLLNGVVDFFANDQGATFDAHVRYENGCSGWASDGTSREQTSSDNCSGSVPEPTTLLLLALGLGVLALGRRAYRFR